MPGDDGRVKIEKMCRVQLEPELQEMAALWPAAKRFEVARKLKRWARQLNVSAKIMIRDAEVRPPRGVRALPRRKAALN